MNTKHGDHSIYRWRVRCFNVCWHDVLISNSYRYTSYFPIGSILMTYGFSTDRNKFVAHCRPLHFWRMNSAIRKIDIPYARDEHFFLNIKVNNVWKKNKAKKKTGKNKIRKRTDLDICVWSWWVRFDQLILISLFRFCNIKIYSMYVHFLSFYLFLNFFLLIYLLLL